MHFFLSGILALVFVGLLDGGTTALVLAYGAGSEANPLFVFVDTAGEALFYFALAPLGTGVLLIPLSRHLNRRTADPAMLRARAIWATSSLNPTLTAFVIATIPVAVALAKLAFAASNVAVLLIGAPILPIDHFQITLLSVSTIAIIMSPLATQTLVALSERSTHA